MLVIGHAAMVCNNGSHKSPEDSFIPGCQYSKLCRTLWAHPPIMGNICAWHPDDLQSHKHRDKNVWIICPFNTFVENEEAPSSNFAENESE